MKWKKILKWAVIAPLLLIVLYFMILFIYELRIMYTEERVKKSIVLNYEKSKPAFEELILYAEGLEPVSELEFIGTENIFISLSSNTPNEEAYSFWGLNDYGDEGTPKYEFELTKEGLAKLNFNDTILEVRHWGWTFQGTSKDIDFKKVTDYLGISANQFDSLIYLADKINCEAITIHKDKSISLRYDGDILYQYEYFITEDKTKVPENYIEIGNGIYCGENRDELFCGWIRPNYDK